MRLTFQVIAKESGISNWREGVSLEMSVIYAWDGLGFMDGFDVVHDGEFCYDATDGGVWLSL